MYSKDGYNPYEGIMKRNDNPTHNPEGYTDMTPHDAIAQDYPKRGEVWNIDDKLVLVVSQNGTNQKSNGVNIVYLFPEKSNVTLNTHVDVGTYEARCEKICSYKKDRIGKREFAVDDETMHKIEEALMCSLGIEKHTPVPAETAPAVGSDVIVLETERNMYKRLYEQLLARITRDKA